MPSKEIFTDPGLGDFEVKWKHIRDIRAFDTVVHEGEVKTVCKDNIKRWADGTVTLFGDSYRCGLLMVKTLVIPRVTPPTKW